MRKSSSSPNSNPPTPAARITNNDGTRTVASGSPVAANMTDEQIKELNVRNQNIQTLVSSLLVTLTALANVLGSLKTTGAGIPTAGLVLVATLLFRFVKTLANRNFLRFYPHCARVLDDHDKELDQAKA